ncbi:hypothetical protein F5Y09DRAFT_31441 [Xylaria sp. FL1042]|nr:hypothetical protein F5Y09DRAFT_31441 [Xylaria sp. FL1042]
MPETLREKASKKIQGPDANPSQLGDPISIKAENSDTVPTKDEAGASPSSSKSRSGNSSRGGETLREKAAKKLDGPNANPSQLGDPISLKNETSPGVPVDSERGADQDEEVVKRDSKL